MAFDPRWKNPQGSSPEQMYLWAQDIIKELRRGDFLPGAPTAAGVSYDNTVSGLAAVNVQDAIDEEDARIDALEAVPPGLVLLASGIVTNAATLDIVLTGFTAYRGLKFVLSNFVPVTNAMIFHLLLSTDGGANFNAANYSYASEDINSNAASNLDGSNSDAQFPISGNGAVGNVVANGGWNGEVTLLDQTNTGVWPRITWEAAWFGGVLGHSITGSGHLQVAQDTNAVRFRFSSGNIASGIWAVYGYA